MRRLLKCLEKLRFALAVTHLIPGRKLYSQSQHAKQVDWYTGESQSLHSQLFGSE